MAAAGFSEISIPISVPRTRKKTVIVEHPCLRSAVAVCVCDLSYLLDGVQGYFKTQAGQEHRALLSLVKGSRDLLFSCGGSISPQNRKWWEDTALGKHGVCISLADSSSTISRL